jgi:hypothetical protein
MPGMLPGGNYPVAYRILSPIFVLPTFEARLESKYKTLTGELLYCHELFPFKYTLKFVIPACLIAYNWTLGMTTETTLTLFMRRIWFAKKRFKFSCG